MQHIRLPQLPQPINASLCTMAHLYRPEMRSGTLTQELWLYEDDHAGQTRRVFKVFAPVTPKGRVRRAQPTRLTVQTLKGFSTERQIWGHDGDCRAELSLEGDQANQLLKQATKLVTDGMTRYRDSVIWYRHS